MEVLCGISQIITVMSLQTASTSCPIPNITTMNNNTPISKKLCSKVKYEPHDYHLRWPIYYSFSSTLAQILQIMLTAEIFHAKLRDLEAAANCICRNPRHMPDR